MKNRPKQNKDYTEQKTYTWWWLFFFSCTIIFKVGGIIYFLLCFNAIIFVACLILETFLTTGFLMVNTVR